MHSIVLSCILSVVHALSSHPKTKTIHAIMHFNVLSCILLHTHAYYQLFDALASHSLVHSFDHSFSRCVALGSGL